MTQSPKHPLNSPQPKPSAGSLLVQIVQTVLVGLFSLPFLPFYVIGRFVWHRPPIVPHMAQIIRYLRLTWSVQPPAPGLSTNARVWLTLAIIYKWWATPIAGSLWLLDELLYGRELNKVEIVNPLFVISAARSGSTQITRYIEADPSITAPNVLQGLAPYLWAWRFIPKTIGRFVTPAKVRARFANSLPPEAMERHEFDPFHADTFDVIMMRANLNWLAPYLGPPVVASEYNFGAFSPADEARLERDCVQLVDRICRKQLLYTGNSGQRFYMKGHFLSSAKALERQYPDATFLTLLRDPTKRLKSVINFMRVIPRDAAMGQPPWEWLTPWLLATETSYCHLEQAWYTKEGGARKCVVRFADFVNDLEGTMSHVYKECFDQDELPPHVPRTHPPRDRKNYSVNYSLAELGIDENDVREELADYIAWSESHQLPSVD